MATFKHKGKTVLLLALLAGAAAALVRRRSARSLEQDRPREATAKVVRRDFAATVLATGAVKPQVGAEVRVGARISGKVERLYANIGDVVKKGQVIAQLEKADLEATVAQRRAELRLAEAKGSKLEVLLPKEVEKIQAEVAKWTATLTLCKKELARQDNLLKRDSATQHDWDAAEEAGSVAESELTAAKKTIELIDSRYGEDLKLARADVERAKAAVTHAEVQLSYATITAPIAGVIASVSTQEGETVAAGLNAPTFVTTIDLHRLQVDAFVDEVDIGKVRVGQQAVFEVDTFPGREFKGEVDAIYPKAVIQENVVNYDVVIEIADPYDGLLRPEMTTNVTIFLAARKGVLAIPSKAVRRIEGKTVVYVLVDGQPQPRPVRVGWKDGRWTEVAEGLDEGETVLLSAPQAARAPHDTP